MNKKTLFEIWQAVKEDATKMKEDYYATLINVGAKGKSKFRVFESDVKKEFKRQLINLVAGKKDQDAQYSSVIKIFEKGAGLEKRAKYTILISHEEESETVDFTLIGGKKEILPEKDLNVDINDPKNFELFHYEIPKAGMLMIKSWDDILYGFRKNIEDLL